MKLTVLQKKTTEKGTWYMCTGNLWEYLSTLQKDFYEYQVQRRIVRNIYLDKLYTSIIKGEPIPPVTLNCVTDVDASPHDEIEVDMLNCDVLDGLQRTFRLWIILELKKIIDEFGFKDYKSLRSWLRNDVGRGALISSQEFVNTNFLKMLFTAPGIDGIIASYKSYEVTLSIWTGLDDNAIIEKMLTLNAGQRAVSSTHQYELLFLHFFDMKRFDNMGIDLLRERDKDYFKVRSGKRQIGQYPLSSIIVAIQSLVDKKPYRVTPSNFITLNLNDEKSSEQLLDYFNTDFLCSFLGRIKHMDEALSAINPRYQSWFGKDTTLSGIFGAIGLHATEKDNVLGVIDNFIQEVKDGKYDFDIDGFEREYSMLSSVRVNLGNVIRFSIYRYANSLLDGINVTTWADAFKYKNDDNDKW